jgi:hypothetical protein
MCLAMLLPIKVGLHTTEDAAEVAAEDQQLHTDTVPLFLTTQVLAQSPVPAIRLRRQVTTTAKRVPRQLQQPRLATVGLQSAIAICS